MEGVYSNEVPLKRGFTNAHTHMCMCVIACKTRIVCKIGQLINI